MASLFLPSSLVGLNHTSLLPPRRNPPSPNAHPGLKRTPPRGTAPCLKTLPGRPLTCHASLLTSPAAKALPPLILSLVTASSGMFAGLAGGITFLEHPSRMETLAIADNVRQWLAMYEKALVIQGSLCAFSIVAGLVGTVLSAVNAFPPLTTFALGLVTVAFTFIGGFTFVSMFPVNYSIYKEHTEQEYLDLLVLWGKLHSVRTYVGMVAFFFAVLAGYKAMVV